jgi:hypothetical protein
MAARNSNENEIVYVVCGGEQRLWLKSAKLALRLMDDGLSCTIDGARRQFRYGDLRSIRLNSEAEGRYSPAFLVATLDFGDGHVLRLNSLTPWGHEDAISGRAYADFIRDIHQRLSQDDIARIRFFRGVAPLEGARKWIVLGGGIVLFAVVIGSVLGEVVLRNFSWPSIVGAVIFFVGILLSRKKLEPPTYDPRELPRELLQEA